MNLGRAQLQAIIDALTVILPARSPADAELSRFFREHRQLGQRDRALVAETVYAAGGCSSTSPRTRRRARSRSRRW